MNCPDCGRRMKKHLNQNVFECHNPDCKVIQVVMRRVHHQQNLIYKIHRVASK